jgi:hypothetical protein
MSYNTPKRNYWDGKNNLKIDKRGWSVLDAPKGSKVFYVSDSEGNDGNDGSKKNPFKTISKGLSQLRSKSSDQVRLKRGDVFKDQKIELFHRDGKSSTERIVVADYGDDSDDRPLILSPKGEGGATLRSSNVAICHLHFKAWWRDPNSPDFDPEAYSPHGISAGYENGDNMLLEGNHIEWFGNNVTVERWKYKMLNNFTMRRNVVNNSWNKKGHSQGLYLAGMKTGWIEENIFDYNGWHPDAPGGRKTMFNHNMYLQFGNSDVAVIGNVTTRASSHGCQHRSGGLFWNNVTAECAAASFNRLKDTETGWNTTLHSSDFWIGEIGEGTHAGGAPTWIHSGFGKCYFHHNIAAHQDTKFGSAGISVAAGNVDNDFVADAYPQYTKENSPLDVEVVNNCTYNYASGRGGGINLSLAGNSKALVKGNSVWENRESKKDVHGGYWMVNLRDVSESDEIDFVDNRYWTKYPSGSFGDIGGEWKNSFEDFKDFTGETGEFKEFSYPDPERKFATYMKSLGYDESKEAFYENARLQRKGNWKDEFTALAFNDYMRQGFGLDVLGEPVDHPDTEPDVKPDPEPKPSTKEPSITRVNLWDISKKKAIGQVDDSVTVNPENLPYFTFSVDVENTESVKFEYNGKEHGENWAPWVMTGNDGDEYNPLQLVEGTYSVVATPYSKKDFQGEKGNSVKFKFVVSGKEVVVDDDKLTLEYEGDKGEVSMSVNGRLRELTIYFEDGTEKNVKL